MRRHLRGIGGNERQRPFRHAPLDREHSRHGIDAKRIGGKAVERIGRQRDEAAGKNPFRRFLDRIALRGLGIDEDAAHC